MDMNVWGVGNVYNEEQYSKNRFFRRYGNLVDVEFAKKNMEAYKSKLDAVGKLCKDIDFNQNVLIVYKADIARELFLTGFSKLADYKTFRYYNIFDILDIYFGNRKGSVNETDDDYMNSPMDVIQDVLCLTVNYYESTNKLQDELAVQTIMNRTNGRVSGGKAKLTWIFSMGEEKDLRARYSGIRDLFVAGKPNFQYYDLNSGRTIIPNYNGGVGKTASTGDDLDDLY
jgi:hypothetical protein